MCSYKSQESPFKMKNKSWSLISAHKNAVFLHCEDCALQWRRMILILIQPQLVDSNKQRLASCIWGSLGLREGSTPWEREQVWDSRREREGAVSWSGWTCEPCGHFHLVIHSRGGMRSEAEPTFAYRRPSPMGCLISLAGERVQE